MVHVYVLHLVGCGDAEINAYRLVTFNILRGRSHAIPYTVQYLYTARLTTQSGVRLDLAGYQSYGEPGGR